MQRGLLHHLSFGVRDLARAAAFYDAVLATVGYRRVFESDTAVGYGLVDGQDAFCIKARAGAAAPGAGFHLAFTARTRDDVHAFHAAALAHGGRDNGAPGLRAHYGPHYYAAFITDPDGYAIEIVINTPA
ncbi:Glyoxalase/Bleomycin resistance protein/Dioxygenase superfamily protein [Andreprevotia lacus DSM 23236]|jgi:catechol 2,3-dioxygenase-like lactoylglutathione lyase family enzyme|uniref:Glyoxalase/Bleomycin resistance protein/Dioxygenase superfamily protein n=1 Tax=Andreprevotia lacus DSM 23236 TaxID=1121001 RepID=A0A1W1XBT1_9NEIS|nr:VOC family protein [Andreprevotia lacus]SMC21342.1 Glyoxalase/Bleomycin resistance protein/Dioxygenase superfamily protein [Andreprevotia lacus DSM 23236]